MLSFDIIYHFINGRFESLSFDNGHRIDHALKVAGHAYLALSDFPSLTLEQRDAILIACILHDINDHKFVSDDNIVDLRRLLCGYVSRRCINMIVYMIDIISCSKNGDSIIEPSWYTIPRYADRLEAMGRIGLKRAIAYSTYTGRPFMNESTPRALTLDDIDTIATPDRYIEYTKGIRVSPTTIDHLYDKILHLDVPVWVQSPTLKSISDDRRKWLQLFIVKMSKLSLDEAQQEVWKEIEMCD